MQTHGLKKGRQCSTATEIWIPIRGFDGLYEVSNCGRVRSVNRVVSSGGVKRKRRGREMRQDSWDKRGYLSVCLSRDGKKRRCLVHRLVADGFVDGFADGLQVNHKDLNKSNNYHTNLEWVSAKDNIAHAKHNKRFHPAHNGRIAKKLDRDDVVEIRRLRSDGVMIKDLAGRYGVSIKTIWNISNNKTWVA